MQRHDRSASVIQADLRREIMGHLGLAESW